jgi:hypothetical protein
MKWKKQNRPNEELHWSPGEMRQAIWFWIFWSIYVCLSALLIVALLTEWPSFLHEPPQYFR